MFEIGSYVVCPGHGVGQVLNLEAKDLGEDFLTETIFYDKKLNWQKNRNTYIKILRIRTNKKGSFVTYKEKDERKKSAHSLGERFVEELKSLI